MKLQDRGEGRLMGCGVIVVLFTLRPQVLTGECQFSNWRLVSHLFLSGPGFSDPTKLLLFFQCVAQGWVHMAVLPSLSHFPSLLALLDSPRTPWSLSNYKTVELKLSYDLHLHLDHQQH